MSEEILIVDDNADIRNIINELIIDAGYKTRLAANYNQALAEIDKKLPDVAILDVKLDKGDNDGIELLSHIKSKNKDTPVIIISGHANIEMAVKSLQHGAFEFIEKPFDQERLLNFIKRAVENFNLKKQNKEYESKLFYSYELIGDSKNISTIREQIDKISLTESRVLINGPSGSGKELIARKIHKKSKRNNKPFIILNGALLDSNKYELELFGEEKDNGSISYDSNSLKDIELSSLREKIGLVSQDVFLFEGTVIENIAYGDLNASESEVWNAAQKSEADEFINNLPQKEQTIVGERGQKLSGGQRQRISIARAILKNPEILILDEATSSVDNETEAAIQRSLDILKKDRTVIVIAHRLSTVRNADIIYVLENGSVVESGNHETLLEIEGVYSKLWSVQTGEKI